VKSEQICGKDFRINLNLKIICDFFLIEYLTIYIIAFPKIQMATQMTRMLRSADLFLSTGDLRFETKK